MTARIVDVRQGVLSKNDALAADLRQRFHAAGVTVLNLVSSPGAGKTALLERTLADLLARGRRAAALVGDLATENDARRLARSGAPVRQIVTAGICHLEAEMVAAHLAGWDLAALDFLFIENVGNLVCPSGYDLGEDARVVLLSTTEGEDKPLKYPPMFHSAHLALLTKIDLAEAVEFDRAAAYAAIHAVRPGMPILETSARTGQGIDAWLAWLETLASSPTLPHPYDDCANQGKDAMPRLDSAMIAAAPRARQRLTISGVVQGVGFRPFVYGLALEHGLAGFVGNDSSGVFVEVEGTTEAIAAFRAGLVEQAPPLAHIERIEEDAVEPLGETSFIIVPSQALTSRSTLVAPDVCVCDACLAELFDPSDRRYRYPFINCTHCGPRFSIIQDIPYDRPKTTMAAFVMCKTCQAEYDDPTNRRFHAQPNACPVCGPQVRFEWPASMPSGRGWDVQDLPDEGPIEAARRVIAQGGIVGVKGLGGFHLACDATNDEALATLRQRKGRVDKPFAIMARDLATARAIAHVDDDEAALLTSRARPIVLLRKRAGSPLSDLVAPGNRMVGVMLPYTPLHYLLLGAYPFDGSDSSDSLTSDPLPPATCHLPPATLVLTSGNLSDEPIIKDDDEARERLTALADAFLLHNREIYARCDDSVMRVFEGKELPVRRSRGYAPFPVKLPFSLPTTLAVGGELKATFCLTRDNHAFMSQHIGDMENLETLDAFEQAVEHFKSIFRARPERIVSDLHPRYLSSRWATDHADGLQHLHVQHHHAHIAAVMAEHGLDGRLSVIGFAFDGTGYGTDGAIWGGEVLLADYRGFRRLAHLAYIPLPGGDAAIKRPYRIALAHLWAAGVPWTPGLPPVDACPEAEHRVLLRQLEAGINTVPTSSMGRLFGAVAALAGIRQTVTYEAQAAIEMEAEVESGEWRVEGEEKLELSRRQYEFALPAAMEDNVPVTFDAAPVIRAVAEDVRARTPVEVISARFHAAVADLILALAVQARQHSGQDVVALSGGVFQNVTLLAAAVDRLRSADFRVLTHRLVPPNDGGLALGQAVIGGLA